MYKCVVVSKVCGASGVGSGIEGLRGGRGGGSNWVRNYNEVPKL